MSGRWIAAAGLMVVLGIAVCAIIVAGLNRIDPPAYGSPDGDTRSAPIAGSRQIGQVFQAPLPGLDRIELRLYPTLTADAVLISFHLRPYPDEGADIWAAEIDPAAVAADGLVRIEFPSQRDSKNKRYYFYLEAPLASPVGAATAGYGPGSALAGGGATVDGRPVPGNLQFGTGYDLTPGDKIDLLLGRLAAGRSGLLGAKAFYAVVGLLYALVLGAFVVWVAAAAGKEQEQR